MKPLLTLLLMTMQLLTGSGVSVYLCIGCDGSYGIKTSPYSCLCDDNGQVEEVLYACDCGDRRCEHRHSDSHAEPSKGGFNPHTPCGCTHVPLLVSSSQDLDFVRSLNTQLVDSFPLLAIVPLVACFHETSIGCSDSLWCISRSDVPILTLTVVSTVVLRC